ncbi:MAG: alpha/beta hydrolase, partial [Gammaproteobacteria bacterium]|nr:alpha/beta hydrolase [Gammaproteobacteria bacterium]
MSNRPLIIIHGWSDSSASFIKLAKLIEAQMGRHVQVINLADYLSMDDEITFFDLAAAMQAAWLAKQLPTQKGSVDILAHSTSALVVRNWLQLYYADGNTPIKHLVLLAPANFGSTLAHKGRAFYGRVLKGFSSKKIFQVGAKLLKGLELASPFTFNLALADRFNKVSYFGSSDILCTILMGNTGYTGISAAANEDGGDGTVRIASANLNCALVDIDFNTDPLQPTYTYKPSTGQV